MDAQYMGIGGAGKGAKRRADRDRNGNSEQDFSVYGENKSEIMRMLDTCPIY